MDSIEVLANACGNNENRLVLSDLVMESYSPPTRSSWNRLNDDFSPQRQSSSRSERDSYGDDMSIGMDSDVYENSEGPDSVSKSPSKGKWSADEDELLRDAVERYGGKNWKKISEELAGRTDVQCLHRWQKVLRPGLVKGPWTQEVRPHPRIIIVIKLRM